MAIDKKIERVRFCGELINAEVDFEEQRGYIKAVRVLIKRI